jgi:hypothetical protein
MIVPFMFIGQRQLVRILMTKGTHLKVLYKDLPVKILTFHTWHGNDLTNLCFDSETFGLMGLNCAQGDIQKPAQILNIL